MRTTMAVVLTVICSVAAACGHKSSNGSADMSGPSDLGCYANPQTSTEILNSCPPPGVTVDQVDKRPTLPLLNPDGTRPPLP